MLEAQLQSNLANAFIREQKLNQEPLSVTTHLII